MLDFVAAAVEGSNLRLLGLCRGTGSISKRALGRFPDASIVAVDNDPALLELGRCALGDRVEWRDADLPEPAQGGRPRRRILRRRPFGDRDPLVPAERGRRDVPDAREATAARRRPDRESGRWRGGGLSAGQRRARRLPPRFSTTPRAASMSRPASATTGPRVRTIGSCVERFQLPRSPDVRAPGDTLERWRAAMRRSVQPSISTKELDDVGANVIRHFGARSAPQHTSREKDEPMKLTTTTFVSVDGAAPWPR
jgi:hypothetical protein